MAQTLLGAYAEMTILLPTPIESIENMIYSVRNYRVMLDSDLAQLYGVQTKFLNQAVKRNCRRFPADFMFQLLETENATLRSQIVTLKTGHGRHRKYLPYVFTEYGVAMLSSVLHSERAIHVNIEIMRTFGRIRAIVTHHKDLALKLEALERKCDTQFQVVFDAIRRLIPAPPVPSTRRIGFVAPPTK